RAQWRLPLRRLRRDRTALAAPPGLRADPPAKPRARRGLAAAAYRLVRRRTGTDRPLAFCLQSPGLRHEIGDLRHPLVLLEIGEEKRPLAAHLPGVAVHDFEAGPHQRSQIDLVDDEQIRAGDPGAALARDLVAGGDVDDVDGDVGELGAEGRGEVVAARFDEDKVEPGEAPDDVRDGGEVDRGVLADRGVRAAAGLDPDDALRMERPRAGQELRVLLGIDVVGDDRDVVAVAHMLAEAVDERGLAGADRAADADAQGTVAGGTVTRCAHDLKSLVYWVS